MADFSRGRISRQQMPTCNPCKENVHARCPTAITRHSDEDFSTYQCACYHGDTDFHAAERQSADAEYEERRNFDPDTGSMISGYGHRASQRWEYQNWAEEL